MKTTDADLRAGIDAHLQMSIADRMRGGASPDEAAAAARPELGNLSQFQEVMRDVRGRRWIEQAGSTLRTRVTTAS